MLTFDGVPVATYGLTGFMLLFLTGMTFIDTKGQADTSMAAVATASVPTFMGSMLTPSAPSFVDSLTNSATNLMKSEEPSLMSKLAGSSEQPSLLSSITGSSQEPSLISKLTGSSQEPSAISKLITPSEEDESYFTARGGKKKNKGKKTRKSKH